MDDIPPGRSGNLPPELDSFINRRDELAEVRRLLGTTSLVTLTGPGGVGKTRLAVQIGAAVRRAFRDGAWLVELADVRDPALVAHAVSGALGLGLATPSADAVAAQLAGRDLLLILDNAEHVIEEAVALVDQVRRRCPRVRALVTSRESLRLPGEVIVGVDPLPFPDPGRALSAPEAERFSAVTLFTDRARAAVRTFTLDETNRAAVLSIVERLEGIPLALELAAARMRALSPTELADRLLTAFPLTLRGGRGAPERHRTLADCMAWSYSQCTPAEQHLWRRLSVFVGSFTLDAARAVCADDDTEPDAVDVLVADLVDKSVVLRVEAAGTADPGPSRFRLLEPVREFGEQQLRETGAAAALRRRHTEWYAALARRIRADWQGPDQEVHARRLIQETANLRAACEASVDGDAETCLRLHSDLQYFWMLTSSVGEGRYLLQQALTAHPEPSAAFLDAAFIAVEYAGITQDLAAGEDLVRC